MRWWEHRGVPRDFGTARIGVFQCSRCGSQQLAGPLKATLHAWAVALFILVDLKRGKSIFGVNSLVQEAYGINGSHSGRTGVALCSRQAAVILSPFGNAGLCWVKERRKPSKTALGPGMDRSDPTVGWLGGERVTYCCFVKVTGRGYYKKYLKAVLSRRLQKGR